MDIPITKRQTISENEEKISLVERIKQKMLLYEPTCIILFGSLAIYKADQTCKANDIDMMYIGNHIPEIKAMATQHKKHGDIIPYTPREVMTVATWLRKDNKGSLLHTRLHARLYISYLLTGTTKEIIATLMLGSDYKNKGLSQRRDERGQFEKQDYSIHQVLHGEQWWNAVLKYARNE